jgi:multidrug transporter EmrE-like cation transporter
MIFSIIVSLIIASLFYAIGDYTSKQFANTNDFRWAISAVISFAFTSSIWLYVLSVYNKLAIVGSIWNVVAFLITILVAVMFFGETISATQIAGIILGLLSIVLMSL